MNSDRRTVPCRFFDNGHGHCRNGNRCAFSHDITGSRGPPQQRPSDIICKFYVQGGMGGCTNGDRCRFRHQMADIVCFHCKQKGSHFTHKCLTPRCPECGSIDHSTPIMWQCRHTGSFNRGRVGGWDPALEGMAADWHCCGCDDRTSKHCAAHRIFRSCSCYKGKETYKVPDTVWLSSSVFSDWPLKELAVEAGVDLTIVEGRVEVKEKEGEKE